MPRVFVDDDLYPPHHLGNLNSSAFSCEFLVAVNFAFILRLRWWKV